MCFAGVRGKHPYLAVEKNGHLNEYEFDIPKSVNGGLGKIKQGNMLVINTSEWSQEAAELMWHLPQNRLLLIELLTYAFRALNRLEELILENPFHTVKQRNSPPPITENFSLLIPLVRNTFYEGWFRSQRGHT